MSRPRLQFYLPREFGSAPQLRGSSGSWRPLAEKDLGWFEADVSDLTPGEEVQLRYWSPDGRRHVAMPLNGCENLNGRFFITEEFESPRPAPLCTGHGKICLEISLEGLLAGFKQGEFAPREIEELLSFSLSQRILAAKIPGKLAELEFDEIMAPLFPAVADRTRLNPKFNYLVYAAGEVDWQIGQPRDFACLVEGFCAAGVKLLPDMIFAHFVRGANPAALDTIKNEKGKLLYADGEPFLFRDYGTWMYDLANADIRRILVQKIVAFIEDFGTDTIRIDYVDGIILQYSRRKKNYGEVFLNELCHAIRSVPQRVLIIGEAFSTQDNPSVQGLIDVFYCPRGFSLVEEIYRPPSRGSGSQYVDVDRLSREISLSIDSNGRETVYAQSHDEAWHDVHVAAGRPHVPWAYGANPAELARRAGMELVKEGLLAPRALLDFTRRRVRAAESLTMFTARLRYLMIPSVDSLSLGHFDQPGRWRMEWGDPVPDDMKTWKQLGLSEREIFLLHDQHRNDMRNLRRIWRHLTPVDEENHGPLIHLEIVTCDARTSVLAMLRRQPRRRECAHMVVWNLGPHAFLGTMLFEVCVPDDLGGTWSVLFDGDYIEPENRLPGATTHGYEPRHRIATQAGEVLQSENVLRVKLGSNSLLVLGLENNELFLWPK